MKAYIECKAEKCRALRTVSFGTS